MSSRRRSRSRDKKNAASKLRMDSKPQTPRITDPSLPAGRRREIDNVMKKARAQTSPTAGAFWDKKLLEVEAKDPNRWRHSGYKSLYIDGSASPSSSNRRSRSRSFTGRGRSPRSPPTRRLSPPNARRSPALRGRSSPIRGRSPRSPQSRRSPINYRGAGRPRSPPPRRTPPSPVGGRNNKRCAPVGSQRRSASPASSLSSCSDESCSVCSPKTRRLRSRSRSFSPPHVHKPTKAPSPPPKSRMRPRPPSPSPSPPRRMPRPMTPPPMRRIPKTNPVPADRPTDPRRQPPPPRPRGSTGEIINVKGVKPSSKPGVMKKPGEKSSGAQQPLLNRIKKEGAPRKKRSGSPGESSGSEDSQSSSTVPIVATTGITLSERFGKIAQWSADRERRDIENMRITKTGSNMKVMVEQDAFLYGTPPRRYSLSPVPAGHYPDELISSDRSRLASWDDVRVRYQYYKDLGYLRDLSLDDYVKWEEWWYKYQDWLANERHYEHWLTTQGEGGGRGGGRRRKKRIPASQRLN